VPPEGRIMIVTFRWRGLRWAVAASGGFSPDETPAADGKAVWSWRRDRGVKLARGIAPATVARNAAHRGERGISRNTIARGKPGCPGCTCSSTRVLSFLPVAHGTMGAVGARLSLRPPLLRGHDEMAQPGQVMPREYEDASSLYFEPLQRSPTPMPVEVSPQASGPP
jgi:hypothetical protein